MMKNNINNGSINILEREEKYTELVTVRELLSGEYFYRIPDYQRGYAWGEEFCELWKDILRLYRVRNNNKHYTGMLALQELKKNSMEANSENLNNTTSFYIVDGQQRITSLIIIIKSLLENILEDDDVFNGEEINGLLFSNYGIPKFAYSNKRTDDASNYFKERILNSNTTYSHTDKYTSNINFAKEYIDGELKKFIIDDIKGILKVVLDQIVFNIYFVTEEFDVRLTFETMNNRGKKLSKLELLKNRLMYLSVFFPAETNLGNQLTQIITDCWKKIYSNLCFKDIQLSDDEYLKAHWIVYKRLNKAKGDSFINDILNKEFSIDDSDFRKKILEDNYEEAFNILKVYVESLGKYSLYWGAVNHPEEAKVNLTPEELGWIKRLSRLGDILFLKATLMVVISENKIMYADKERFYSLVEQFVFINRFISQDVNDMSFLISVARDIMLAEPNDKTKEIKKLCNQIEKHEQHITKERAERAIKAFGLYIADKPKYFYDWNGLKYFLYEYDESLQIENAAIIEWYKLSSVSIEHVFPQTPDTDYWKIAFQGYLTDENQIRITNSLGNLLLLSSGAENSSLKNFSYPVKRNMEIDSRKFAYSNGSRSAKKIAEENHWTPKQIYKRTNELLSFMYYRWFDSISGLTKEQWDTMVKDARLVNFDYIPLSDSEYNERIIKLDAIDTSTERKKADEKVLTSIPVDYLRNEIEEYFNTDILPIHYNNKKISYKKWFTFILKKDDTGQKPIKFECGVMINDVKIRIDYKYEENQIAIQNMNDYSYFNGIAELDEYLQLFLRSFFKYLKKAQNKTLPDFWIEESI